MKSRAVVNLVEKRQESAPEVIARLKEALEAAENGNIQNCAVILIADDGGVLDCWANGYKPFTVVGALESVKAEFMDSFLEKR